MIVANECHPATGGKLGGQKSDDYCGTVTPIIYLSYLMNATLILWRVGGLHNHGSHQADFSATLWRVSAIQVPCLVGLGEVATVFPDIVGQQQLQEHTGS